MHRFAHFLAIFGLLAGLLAGCAGSLPGTAAPTVPIPVSTGQSYWPTAGWRSSSPAEQGMDSARLDEMLGLIQEEGLNLHSLLVIRHGYMVSETYFGSFRADNRHELFSCTKSFMSTLVGIALDKGLIQGVGRPVLDFFPGRTFANLDARKSAMTLEDVLTMRTGLDWQEGDPAYAALAQSPDWARFMLDKAMAQAPGSTFNYCSGCSHLLSAILREAAGQNARDFAEENLFKPLGISNALWAADRAGNPVGGWGLQITPRDMAKLGYLFLRGGVWDGQQIISAGWVENATRKHTAAGKLGYGYQWWTYPALAAYTALGMNGQTIFVIPAADLVIVTTAGEKNHDRIFRLIEDYIVPAVLKQP